MRSGSLAVWLPQHPNQQLTPDEQTFVDKIKAICNEIATLTAGKLFRYQSVLAGQSVDV